MTNRVLNINNAAVVKHTARLEKMHRSALPVAIRGTLNNAAFDVKQITMPKTSKRAFENRQANFFKANSNVRMIKNGNFNVKTMNAVVGFKESKLRGSNNSAVKDLEDQEHGGGIGGRSLRPLPQSRISSAKNRGVQVKYRLADLKNVVNANKVVGTSKKQKFIKAAFKAKKLFGKDAFVLGNIRKGGRLTLSHIKKFKKDGRNKISIKRVPIYSYKAGEVWRVKPKGFMRRASMESGLKINKFYINQARKQFERLNK